MQLQLATWQDVEAYLGRSHGVVIPLGSTEQHGPIGVIGTDAVCAQAVAETLGARHDVLVAPTIAYTMAQFNLAFPGTISVRASTLMALVTDCIRSLVRQGFTRIYFVNGHGGNLAPVRAAIQDLYAEHGYSASAAPFRALVRSWWDYPQVAALRSALYGAAEGMHATPSEIAITQHVLPKTVRTSDAPAPRLLDTMFLRDHANDNHLDAAAHRAAFPDGRVGSDSALARAPDGARLLEAAVSDAWADYQAFLAA